MSGICAVWRTDGQGDVTRMLAGVAQGLTLFHEERQTEEIDGSVGLGVSARFATQMIFANPHIMVACDADLTNESELRAQLGVPRTASTAQLMAGLYERSGQAFVERLRGNFSFTLWDKRARSMFAAIDQFGANRLVYYHDGKVLLIASRIHALLASNHIVPEVNPRSLVNVLNFSTSLGPDTVLRGVQRLPPGTLLRVSDGNLRSTKYWDMCYAATADADENALSRELEVVVEHSVAAHCSHVSANIGAFLSGGTDSSTVVGLMSRARQGGFKTFSIGYEEASFDELKFADIAAKKFGTDHHIYRVSARDCYELLPRMVQSFDEPFGNSSAIATYFCARLAAQNGVQILLAGDGGDELFGGNERYATTRLFQFYQLIPRTLRKGFIEPVLRGLPMKNGLVGKARSYTNRSNLPGLERFFSYHFLCAHALEDVFESDFREALGNESILTVPSQYFQQAPAKDDLDRFLYVDLKITLGDSDLPKVTCMCELAGIQARFPLLDQGVAEFSGRIPAGLKVKGLQKRYLFKRAFQELLPTEILKKKKHGFGIPVATWIKSDRQMRELARDTLLSRRAFERGYFRRGLVEDLFRRHESDSTTYYGDTLWTLLALELWHRQVIDQPAGAA